MGSPDFGPSFAFMGSPDFGPSFVPSQQANMNGEYVFSSTPGGVPGKFPTHYRQRPLFEATSNSAR